MNTLRSPGGPGKVLVGLLLAALLGFAGCAYELVSGGRINQAEADQIEQQIQAIRALSFKTPVPTVVKTPDEVERMVVEDLKRDYSDEQLDADGRVGSMLGLYPPGSGP